MTEIDYKMLSMHFEALRQQCDTPEKATQQLRSEGLLDEDGNLSELYRETENDLVCR